MNIRRFKEFEAVRQGLEDGKLDALIAFIAKWGLELSHEREAVCSFLKEQQPKPRRINSLSPRVVKRKLENLQGHANLFNQYGGGGYREGDIHEWLGEIFHRDPGTMRNYLRRNGMKVTLKKLHKKLQNSMQTDADET